MLKYIRIPVLFASAFASSSSVSAPTEVMAQLVWQHPTSYVDGTYLDVADIAQTNLQCSSVIVSGNRQTCSLSPVSVSPTTLNFTYTYTITVANRVCFQVQTQLANGSVSDWSEEACKDATPIVPKVRAPVLTVK